MSSPWGKPQAVYRKGPGVAFVSCAGHGGYRVSRALAEKVMPVDHLRVAIPQGGYYYFEEDCNWAIVGLHFPEYFPGLQDDIIRSLNRWNPQLVGGAQ